MNECATRVEPVEQIGQVLEIDGPPMAYIEFTGTHLATGFEIVGRLHYRTIACMGETEASVLAWMRARLEEVHAACGPIGAFIIWRTRPYAHKRVGRGHLARWRAYARLVTSKPIDAAVWATMEQPEGAHIKHVAP